MKIILKNNKGYMLIEIVVASVIALVMAYFLIDITLKLVNKNNDYYLNSVFLADKNIVTKEIMDDINSKKLVKVEKIDDNNVKLTYDDGIIKDLSIENKTIIYGNYKKQMSEKLNMDEIKIDADGNILKISIPMYSNYSKENYGISISLQYSEDLEIVLPLILRNADITVTNIKVGNSIVTKFPTGPYIANVNCDGAIAKYDYNSKKIKVIGVTVEKNANCSPIFTSKTKVYLNNYIKNNLVGTTQGNGQVVNENGYRYEGKNPNNYIYFNNELWRIIGVFDSSAHGQSGQYLTKIIREESIGPLVWGTSDTDYHGDDDWSISDLYKLLNGAYYNATDGTNSGHCFRNGVYISGVCDYRVEGIQDEYRSMIKNVIWYLGGYNTIEVNTNNIYSYERETSEEKIYYKKGNARTAQGYIGLMYVSDYGYSVLSSVCPRTRLLDSYDNKYCGVNSWLGEQRIEWTITHKTFKGGVDPDADTAPEIFSIGPNGEIDTKYPIYGYNVRPTLYLDSSVYVITGDGTLTNPYIIGI